jgi:hypothetical protein
MIKRVLLVLLFVAFLLVPAGQASATLHRGYALADGTVTGIRPFISGLQSPCHIAYEVFLDGSAHSGEDISHDFCHLEVGDMIKIKYLESDPRRHEVASSHTIANMTSTSMSFDMGDSNFLFFAIPIGLVVVFIIVVAVKGVIIKGAMSGVNGDKPATVEQKKLIQEGFRKLGVFHDVKKRMTQAQARETLQEIDRQLGRKNKK